MIRKYVRNVLNRITIMAASVLFSVTVSASVWIKGVAEGGMGNDFGFTFEQEVKIDERQLYNEESLFLLTWETSSWLKLAAGYRLVF